MLHLQKKYDDALTAYAAALRSDPDWADVYLWRGAVFLFERRDAEAVAAFDAYLEKHGAPTAALYRQRGLAQARLGRHAEAVEDYTRALDAEPQGEEIASLRLYRGQEYLAVDAPRPALADFETALRLRPTSADAALCCASARIKLGKTSQALADADRAVRDAGEEPRVWQGAAHIYAQAGASDSRYLDRAATLLRTAHDLVAPGDRLKFWRDTWRRMRPCTPSDATRSSSICSIDTATAESN